MWALAILGAVVAIVMIILIHEYGHFIVARWCGVRVLRFSVGFGRAIWSRQGRDGVEYRLAIFPLGGYVKMLDEHNLEEGQDLPDDAFSKAPLWKRFCIVIAGPLVNMLLAIILFVVIAFLGSTQVKPIVGSVAPASMAAQAGVKANDELLSIANVSTPTWEKVMLALAVHAGDKQPLRVLVKRGQQSVPLRMSVDKLSLKHRGDNTLSLTGLIPYFPRVLSVVSHVLPNSPAERAGLRPGDRIMSFAGVPTPTWTRLVDVIQGHYGLKAALLVDRQGVQIKKTVLLDTVKESGKPHGFLGITPRMPEYPASYLRHHRLPWQHVLPSAVNNTWQLISMNARMIYKLFTGSISTKMLGGPISVFRAAGQASLAGWAVYLRFVAFISVTIGFVNLLPIPGLDGGHVLFQLIEWVSRRPVHMRVQQAGYAIGLFVLIAIMLQATLNDVLSLY